MIICPVCEHQQAQGDECENCGKKLVSRSVAVPVVTLPELEVTPLVRPGLPVQATPLAELEATRLRTGPDLPAQAMPDVERTRFAAAANLPLQSMPDLDTGRAPDDGVRTSLPEGQVVCRYCRNVQAVGAGLMCERCGMRLPMVARRPAESAETSEEWVLCRDCGKPARVGRMCPSCGSRLTMRS